MQDEPTRRGPRVARALALAVVLAFAAVLALVLVLLALVNDGATYGASPLDTSSNFPLPSAVSVGLGCLVALAAASLCVCAHLARRRAALSDREFLGIALALTGLVLTAQIALVSCIYAVPGWDAGTILEYARWKASGLDAASYYGGDVNEWVTGYLGLYPNNALLTAVFTVCYLVGDALGTDGLYLACVLGALCVSTGGLLTCLLVARIGGSHAVALVSLALYTGLFSLSPWVGVPYSDTFAALFVAATLFLGARCLDAQGRPLALDGRGVLAWLRAAAPWLALGIVALVGYLIKPTVLITGMAVVAVALVRLLVRREPARRRLARGGAAVVGLVLAAGLVLGIAAPGVRFAMGAGEDPTTALGMSHFLMMGQNDETTGSYLQSDVDFSRSVADPTERAAMERAAAISRVAGRGLAGNADFYARKLLYSFGDGTFLWAGEAGDEFFQAILPARGPLAYGVRSLVYRPAWQGGADLGTFRMTAQIAWCAVLALALAGGVATVAALWRRVPPVHPIVLATMLAVLGLALYLLLFECRARYLFCFGPAMIICAGAGLAFLSRLLTMCPALRPRLARR